MLTTIGNASCVTTKPIIRSLFIEMYYDLKAGYDFHYCMVCYERTIFGWDTTI